MLQDLTIEKHADLNGKSFWWTNGCYPLMPWLWTKPDNVGKQEYVKWNPVDPFFIDDSERRYRFIKASSRERETQRNVITQILNPGLRHTAYLTTDGVGGRLVNEGESGRSGVYGGIAMESFGTEVESHVNFQIVTVV
ncbi:hypothetical protein BDV33DRAFT_206024 [Aspergillus novoparasiticus]|uniref:Uncharacterized protein n=1 Tax=Aspergillus novoparasiticus TaxID=986946 RepID=A0A5N6EJL6_9EURO|nr:hypothetical protein BDV33DRAFT_206024 [Aspergillus novoparasiticus]